MKKDTFYFTHDYNARTDVKIKRLLEEHGWQGYGIYWALIEDLYNNANALPMHLKSIAYDLRTEIPIVESIIKDFQLFEISGDILSSNSVKRRLDQRNIRSGKARESAKYRWENANAMRTQCEGNAIKESKGKEIKERKGEDVAAYAHPLEKEIYPIEHCALIAMRDERFVSANKVTELHLKEFNKELERRGIYEKLPKDYKEHYASWSKKIKFEPKPDRYGPYLKSTAPGPGN